MTGTMKKKEYDIFISYSRNDYDTYSVGKLLDSLNHRGFKVWLDKGEVDPGSEFMAAIFRAIESCKVLVFLSSKESNQSRYVQLEILYAQAKKKIIIPITLDNSDFNSSLLGFLNSRNYVKLESYNWAPCVNEIGSFLLENLDAKELYIKANENKDDDHKYLDYLEKSAKRGYVQSQIELGKYFSDSDQYEAERWFREAAESREPLGLLALGRYYISKGKERGQAIALFKKAAEVGYDEALVDLGDLFFREGGNSKDGFYKAYEMYGRAQKSKNKSVYARAKTHMARMLFQYLNLNIPVDHLLSSPECVELILESTECKDADALYQLGWFYEYGWIDDHWCHLYSINEGDYLALGYESCSFPLLARYFTVVELHGDYDLCQFDRDDIAQYYKIEEGLQVAIIKEDRRKAYDYYLQSAKRGGILAMVRLAEDYYLFGSFAKTVKSSGLFFFAEDGLSKEDAKWCALEAEKKGINYARTLINRSPDIIEQAIVFWEHPNPNFLLFSWEKWWIKKRLLFLHALQSAIKSKIEQQMKAQYICTYFLDRYSLVYSLRDLAERGWRPAQWGLAVITEDSEESFRWLLLYATTRPVVGAKFSYLLSKYYQYGIGTPRDMQRCLFWLEKSAQRGLYYAKKELAERYREGIDVVLDAEKANEIESISHTYADIDQLYEEMLIEIPDELELDPIFKDPFLGKGPEILYKDGYSISEDVSKENCKYYATLMMLSDSSKGRLELYMGRPLPNWDTISSHIEASHEEPLDNLYVRRLDKKIRGFFSDFEVEYFKRHQKLPN